MANLVDLNELPEGYGFVDVPQPSLVPPITFNEQPNRSNIQRTVLPLLHPSSDSLRQFYAGSVIPQKRVIPSTVSSASSGGSSTTVASTLVTGSTSTTNQTNNNVSLNTNNASITTPVLSIGQTYQTTILLSKAFLLFTLNVDSPARVELYSTNIAQLNDLSRGVGTPPTSSNCQGIISDVAIFNTPYFWEYVNTTGSNGDTPITNTIYVTVTNLGTASTAIVVSILYLAMEI